MKRWAVRGVRVIVGALFIYAGWLKSRDPGALIRDLWNYRLIPEDAAYWIAAALPYLEIVAGIALITGLQRRGAHLVLGGMLAVFIGALASAWFRGLDINCGCFGSASAEHANYPLLIGRNLLLLAGVAWSAIAARAATRDSSGISGA
ncbi:MAG TPA: MauE/DoxX family redox-associated membrane protein [Opitutaceae bacterium]